MKIWMATIQITDFEETLGYDLYYIGEPTEERIKYDIDCAWKQAGSSLQDVYGNLHSFVHDDIFIFDQDGKWRTSCGYVIKMEIDVLPPTLE